MTKLSVRIGCFPCRWAGVSSPIRLPIGLPKPLPLSFRQVRLYG